MASNRALYIQIQVIHMGQEITQTHFNEQSFQDYRRCLFAEAELLQSQLHEGRFSDVGEIGGYELESWLVDHNYFPAPINQRFLASIDNPLVVLGILQIAFGKNAVPAGIRIFGQSRIFFNDLVSSPPNANIGTIAVKNTVFVLEPSALSACIHPATPIIGWITANPAGLLLLCSVSHVLSCILFHLIR